MPWRLGYVCRESLSEMFKSQVEWQWVMLSRPFHLFCNGLYDFFFSQDNPQSKHSDGTQGWVSDKIKMKTLLWLLQALLVPFFLRVLGILGKQMSSPGTSETPIGPFFRWQPGSAWSVRYPGWSCPVAAAGAALHRVCAAFTSDWLASLCGRSLSKNQYEAYLPGHKQTLQSIAPLYAKHLYQGEIRGLGVLCQAGIWWRRILESPDI